MCRQMKKDKKYFLEKLSCGISRMKHNSSIEQLRGPKAVKKINRERRISRQITYDEMLPGSPESEDLFSIELFPKSKPQLQLISTTFLSIANKNSII